MVNFIKAYLKNREFKAQIAKYQAKSELLKYKNNLQANKTRAKTQLIGGIQRQLESAETLKKYVAETNPESQIIQILNNPTVQQLLRSVAVKLMGGGSVSATDDELITIYKKLPDDIKGKVKDFALNYIGGK